MATTTDIKKYCESNRDFQLILSVFKESYIEAFNKRKVAHRKEIKKNLHRNFGYWYYSNLNPEGETSPANFINSDIAFKFKENKAVVFPKCMPVFKKDRMIDIIFEYNVFSLDNHPFINDMATLIRVFKDYRFPRDGGYEMLSEDEQLSIANDDAANFAFRETAYVETLFDVCEGLSLISWKKEKQYDRLITNETKFKAFYSLTLKEQLQRIVYVIVSYAALGLDEFEDIKLSKEQLFDTLKKGMTVSKFLNKTIGNLLGNMTAVEFSDGFEAYLYDENLNADYSIDEFENKYPKIQKAINAIITYSSLYRYFFLPIGQYLQLIELFYEDEFTFSRDDNLLISLGVDDTMEEIKKFIVYMAPPNAYRLSPMGTMLFRDGKSDTRPPFHSVSHIEYHNTLNGMLYSDADEEEEYDEYDDDDDDNDYDDNIKSEGDAKGEGDIKGKGDAKGEGDALAEYKEDVEVEEDTDGDADEDNEDDDDAEEVTDGDEDESDEKSVDGDGDDDDDENDYDEDDYDDDENQAAYSRIEIEVKRFRSRKKGETFIFEGTDTLAVLADRIVSRFDLDWFHLYAFYFGGRFYDQENEIMASDGSSSYGVRGAGQYKFNHLYLSPGQTFLFLYDFGDELKFQIKILNVV